MKTPEPSTSRSARQFVQMGVQLQEALKTGEGLEASLDAFCRETFARKDLSQSLTFLLSLVQKDVKRLAELLKVRHLVAELSVGSQILSSLVAAQWDKADQTDKLAELADGILAAHMRGTDLSATGEFSAALAKTIAVMHPARSRSLLEMAAPHLTDAEHATMLKEAWDWQNAGELLAGKSWDFRRFWHQTLRQQRGDWFWDTAEGRKALAGLDSGTEDLNVRGGVFRRSVPAWAWQAGEKAPELPTKEAVPVPVENRVTEAAPATPLKERESKAMPWLLAALLACVIVVVAGTQTDLSTLLPMRPVQAASASAPPATLSTPVTPATLTGATADTPEPRTIIASKFEPLTESTQPESVTPTASPAPLVAAAAAEPAPSSDSPTLPSSATSAMTDKPADVPVSTAASAPESATTEKAPLAAQPIHVSLTQRHGWVRTPLGTEFQVTTANAKDGRITDEFGRVWKLPADPGLVAEVKTLHKAVIPYTGEPTEVTGEEWKPGQRIPFGTTGWTFSLPANLPEETPAADPASATSPKAAVPGAKPGTGMAAVTAKPKSAAKAAPAAKKSKNTGKLVTTRRPTGEAQRRELTAVTSEATREELVFVTRANSIRMNYKGGYWESRPGAYLSGAGENPTEWARDMTLRERSSGTIPDGYMFKVMDRGVVRVLPEPPAR